MTILGCGTLLIGYFEGRELTWIGVTILLLAALLSGPYLKAGYKKIREKAESKKQSIEVYRKSLTWYSWSKITFQASTALLLISIILIVLLPNSIFSRNSPFFSDSLILLVNLVGFVFIVAIFMIQNITQSYSSNLSKEIFRDKYLKRIFIGLVGIAIYNLTGLYLELGGLYQFLSYVLAIISFFYILSLALLTSYYLEIENTIMRVEQRIISKISKDNIYRVSESYEVKDDEFIEKLGNDCFLITNTAIAAIDNNEHQIVIQCIKSLVNIGVSYLNLLESSARDDFITDLNKQFELLIRKTSEEYITQKYLDDLYKSLGKLARETYISTYDSSQTSSWLRSLGNIVKQIYPEMDLTEAVGGSIKEINRTVILAIQTTEPNTQYDPGHFSRRIDNIAEIGLRHKSGFIVRHCLDAYTWQFLCRVNSFVSERAYHQSTELKNSIEDLIDLYTEAIESPHIDNSILEAKFFGLHSFMTLLFLYGLYSVTPQQAAVFGVTPSPPEEFDLSPRQKIEFENPRLEQEFIKGLEGVVSFLDRTAKAFRESNFQEVYSGYVEFAFIVFLHLQLKYADKTDLVNQLCSSFVSQVYKECIDSNRNKPDFDIETYLLEFLILTVWCYREYDDGMYMIVKHFVELYEDLVHEYGEDDARWLYICLKLIGCLIKPLDGIEDTQDLIEDILIRDYKQPDNNLALSVAPIGLRLEYPGEEMGNGIKGLSTRQIWSDLPQQIERDLYEDIVSRCSNYNDYLESQSS